MRNKKVKDAPELQRYMVKFGADARKSLMPESVYCFLYLCATGLRYAYTPSGTENCASCTAVVKGRYVAYAVAIECNCKGINKILKILL